MFDGRLSIFHLLRQDIAEDLHVRFAHQLLLDQASEVCVKLFLRFEGSNLFEVLRAKQFFVYRLALFEGFKFDRFRFPSCIELRPLHFPFDGLIRPIGPYLSHSG